MGCDEYLGNNPDRYRRVVNQGKILADALRKSYPDEPAVEQARDYPKTRYVIEVKFNSDPRELWRPLRVASSDEVAKDVLRRERLFWGDAGEYRAVTEHYTTEVQDW